MDALLYRRNGLCLTEIRSSKHRPVPGAPGSRRVSWALTWVALGSQVVTRRWLAPLNRRGQDAQQSTGLLVAERPTPGTLYVLTLKTLARAGGMHGYESRLDAKHASVRRLVA